MTDLFEERIRERVERQQEKVDPTLTQWGFTKSFRLDDRAHLYTTCERCGALLVVTRNRGRQDSLTVHWRSHHPLRVLLAAALARAEASLRRGR